MRRTAKYECNKTVIYTYVTSDTQNNVFPGYTYVQCLAAPIGRFVLLLCLHFTSLFTKLTSRHDFLPKKKKTRNISALV